ncbi:hypothetical protein [Streptomyces pratensis]|uniref:hypothetical protein n=1 Tax=Streptomyces pratensis TaxID=1169025 RepID=UPI003015CE54
MSSTDDTDAARTPRGTGDQFTISIGGDSSAPVVAGHENTVEVHRPREAEAGSGPSQKTTVRDHGTAYTVMRGELNIHHDAATRSPEAGREPRED